MNFLSGIPGVIILTSTPRLAARHNAWDNACIESFHSLLKREWLNRFKIFDYKHAYRLVFEYIETFYNTVRIHSHCGYFSPDEYEKQYRNKLLELEQKLAG